MSSTQRQRLQELIELLIGQPEGLTTPEIGRHFGVTRQTAHSDLLRLSGDGIPVYQIEDTDRWTIQSGDYIKNVRLSLAQAWFMYLPIRRIVRANLHRYPLVRSLLFRVAHLLHPAIAEQLVPDEKETKEVSDKLFTDLISAWHNQEYVEVRYLPLNEVHESVLTIAPWWFEPAVWSDSFYLIAGIPQKHGPDKAITLKIDRIRSVRELARNFERPSGQDILKWLETTWGIWVGEGESLEVVLRFHNRQYARLRETRWHPTEKLEVADDGSILWRAYVSEPREMLPWIRGWGADVEVLQPESIRRQVAQEAMATARLYGLVAGGDEDFF